MSVSALEFPENSFDIVVSFETIEHLTHQDQILFLTGIRRILAKDGILIISTPRKGIWDMFVNKCDNPYHLCELSEEDFIGFLSGYFDNVDTYYQNYLPTSFIHGKGKSDSMPILYSTSFAGMEMSSYVITVCSQKKTSVDLSGMYITNSTQATLEREFGFSDMMLFCNYGHGFTEEEKLRVPMSILEDGRQSVTFILPNDVNRLRFDPGDFACSIDELECSDPTITMKPQNGLQTGEGSYLFPNYDPIFFLEREAPFKKGEQIRFSFRYHRASDASLMKSSLSETYLQLTKDYLKDIAKKNKEIEKKDACIMEMKNIQNKIYSSLSWKITRPLRVVADKLLRIMHRV